MSQRLSRREFLGESRRAALAFPLLAVAAGGFALSLAYPHASWDGTAWAALTPVMLTALARRARPVPDDEVLEGLSARNRLHGFIDEVRVDGLLAQVRLRVGDQALTAVITADAVRALKLRRGEDALAIIKSTEVMIARGRPAASPPGRRRGRRR